MSNTFIRITALSFLFLYALACFPQEREHTSEITMELIDVFCPVVLMKENFLPKAKIEIQKGISKKEVLPHWNADINSGEFVSIEKVRERYNEWSGFIDNIKYNELFLKVIEDVFTADELSTLNQYLNTGFGKKIVSLFKVKLQKIEKSEEALPYLDPSDEITIKYFAEDLDDFIAFLQTELGKKFIYTSTETDIRFPRIMLLCSAVMRSVLSESIKRYNLERFQNENARETKSVIVASASITKDALLNKDQLALREYPKGDIPAGSLYLNALDLLARGRVISDIQAGTPVTMKQIESTLVVVPRDSVSAGAAITKSKFAVRNIASANVKPDYLKPAEFAGVEFNILADAIEPGRPVPKSSILSQQESCQLAGGLRSIDGTELLDVSLTNSRENNVRLNWINYDGKEVGYGEIMTKQTKKMQTYKTHPWVIRSLEGECLALFNFTENAQVTVK